MMTMSGSIINFDRFKDGPETQTRALMNAYQGGANSGFEIQGMDLFKENSLSKEFPEMKDEIELIISTESYLAKLVDFRYRVNQNKGMSRGMAHELLELIPSLESHTTPRHFTEEISGVGVETSLEAIDFKLWGLIAAGIAFVMGLIYKFITWFHGGSGGSGGGGGSASVSDSAEEGRVRITETVVQMDTQGDAVQDAQRVVASVQSGSVEIELPAVVDHDKVNRSHLPDGLKEIVTEATKPLGTASPPEDSSPVPVEFHIHEILNRIDEGHVVSEPVLNPNKYARIVYGERSRDLEMLLGSFGTFADIAQVNMLKVELMQEMTEALASMKPEDELSLTIKFREQVEKLDAGPFANGFNVAAARFNSVQEWKNGIRDFIDSDHTEIKFTYLNDVLSMYNIGHTRMRKVEWAKVATLFDLIEKAHPVLKLTEQVVEHIGKGGDDGRFKSTGALAEILLIPLRSCQKDMIGLMEIYALIFKVYAEVMENGAAVVNLLRRNAQGIKTLYETYDYPVPPKVAELVKDLEAITAAYFESVKANHSVSLIGRGKPSSDD